MYFLLYLSVDWMGKLSVGATPHRCPLYAQAFGVFGPTSWTNLMV